jgi:hypothetical protein
MTIRSLEIAVEELRRRIDELEQRALPSSDIKAETEQARAYLNKAVRYGTSRDHDKATLAVVYAAVCYGAALTELEQAERLKRVIDEILG